MRAAGFAEAPAQHVRFAVEKQQLDVVAPARVEQGAEVALYVARIEAPRARIDAERQRALAAAVGALPNQIREQRQRQVVDRLVAEVFEDLERRRLAGAGHARHQHEGTLGGAVGIHHPAEGCCQRTRLAGG